MSRMQKGRRLAAFVGSVFLLVASLGGESCIKSPPMPIGEPGATPIPPAAPLLQGRPRETAFAVELATELNSTTNRPGEPLRARVITPLEAADGDTVVPVDATLEGRVIAVSGPVILVRFDVIETRWGRRAVRATFSRDQPEPSVIGERAQFEGYDGSLQPASGIPLVGDPPPPGELPNRPLELPPGARLQLVLTDPIAIRALGRPGQGVSPVD